MDVRLILVSGKQKGREVNLSRGVYLVGRSGLCQIRPKNLYVSRKHCAFLHRKREVFVQDLGSKTGTYVNRVRIETQVAVSLRDGDRIRVGKTKFLIAIAATTDAKDRENRQQSSKPNGRDSLRPDVDPDDDLALQEDDQDAELALSEGHPSAADAREADSDPQCIEDVLGMLEDDEDDEKSPSRILPGSVFSLSAHRRDSEVEVEDDSDGNVEFAAPKSSDPISAEEPLPSYATRKDWDVRSVYSWINQKETFARQDERRAQRKVKEVAKMEASSQAAADEEPAEKYTPRQRAAQERSSSTKVQTAVEHRSWREWLESDAVRPALLIVVSLAFFGWLAWNAWLLISFKG